MRVWIGGARRGSSLVTRRQLVVSFVAINDIKLLTFPNNLDDRSYIGPNK